MSNKVYKQAYREMLLENEQGAVTPEKPAAPVQKTTNSELTTSNETSWEKVPENAEEIKAEIITSVSSITGNENSQAYKSKNRSGNDQIMFEMDIEVLRTEDIQELIKNGMAAVYFKDGIVWPVFVGEVLSQQEMEDTKPDKPLPDTDNDFNKPSPSPEQKSVEPEKNEEAPKTSE